MITNCILFASSFVDCDMFMRFLGIGIGHCNQHPTKANLGASDGNDSQTLCMDDGNKGNGNMAAEEGTDTQDDEEEDTDLEEYDKGDSDEYDDSDFGHDNL
jgi:hypothetical protein